MNRVFQAKIQAGNWILLAAVFAASVHFMWHMNGLLILLSLLLMIIVIERIIHSRYTLTHDGMLMIERGRFSRKQQFAVADIERIERISGVRIMGKSLNSFLLITCSDGKQYAVTPRNEEDFLKCIEKKRRS